MISHMHYPVSSSEVSRSPFHLPRSLPPAAYVRASSFSFLPFSDVPPAAVGVPGIPSGESRVLYVLRVPVQRFARFAGLVPWAEPRRS